MVTPESLDHSVLCDDHSACCEAELNAAISKALKEKQGNVHNLVGVVHDNPYTDQESQNDEHVRREQDAIDKLEKNWSKEVAISTQYHTNKEPFIDKL